MIPLLVVLAASPFVDRFEGSELRWMTAANLDTFAPKLRQTANRTVISSMLLSPRFDAGKDVRIFGQLGVSYEWTNSDISQRLHEPMLTDTTLGATWHGPSWMHVGATIALPSSKVSQARTMVLAPGLVAGVQHAFFDGALALSGSGRYVRPLYRYTTPGIVDDLQFAPQCFGGGVSCIEQASGIANVRDSLSWNAAVVGRLFDFSAGLSFETFHQFPYALDRTDPPVRVLTHFAMWIDYTPIEWATAQLGYSMQRNIIGGSGGYENPLFDRHEEMRLFLMVALRLPVATNDEARARR